MIKCENINFENSILVFYLSIVTFVGTVLTRTNDCRKGSDKGITSADRQAKRWFIIGIFKSFPKLEFRIHLSTRPRWSGSFVFTSCSSFRFRSLSNVTHVTFCVLTDLLLATCASSERFAYVGRSNAAKLCVQTRVLTQPSNTRNHRGWFYLIADGEWSKCAVSTLL